MPHHLGCKAQCCVYTAAYMTCVRELMTCVDTVYTHYGMYMIRHHRIYYHPYVTAYIAGIFKLLAAVVAERAVVHLIVDDFAEIVCHLSGTYGDEIIAVVIVEKSGARCFSKLVHIRCHLDILDKVEQIL